MEREGGEVWERGGEGEGGVCSVRERCAGFVCERKRASERCAGCEGGVQCERDGCRVRERSAG